MGLKRIIGAKQLVDLKADVRQGVLPPSLILYPPARTHFRSLALGLLGMTALWSEQTADAIREAAASITDEADEGWGVEETRQVMAAVGSINAPSHVKVERVEGQPVLLMRAATPTEPGVHRLRYREGNSNPDISLLAALRPSGITVPKGMCMEVPVALTEDEDGLCLAAFFNRGKLRDATGEPEEDEIAE